MALYDTAAFIMRYWFVIAIGAVLLMTALVSFSEYRERKAALYCARTMPGYIEITRSTNKDEIGSRLSLDAVNTLGRDSSCDLVVDARRVRKRHMRIFCREDGVYAVGFAGCRVELNGEKISEATQIFSGDVIGIGDARIAVRLKEDKA